LPLEAPAIAAIVVPSDGRWVVRWEDGAELASHGPDAADPQRAYACSEASKVAPCGLVVQGGAYSYDSPQSARMAARAASAAARRWAADPTVV